MSVVSDIMAESTKIIGFVAFFYIMNAFVKGLGALGSALNKARGGLGGGLSKAGGKFGEDLANRNKLRALEGREGKLGKPVAGFRRWQARREGIREGVKRETGRAAHSYLADQTTAGSTYAKQVAGGGFLQQPSPQAMQRALANASATRVREFVEEVGNEKATMSKMSSKELNSIMRDGDASEARRSAAAGKLMKVGTDSDIHRTLTYLGTEPPSEAISTIQQQVADDMGSRKPISLGAGAISDLTKGTYRGNFDSKIQSRLTSGKLSAESLAKASAEELEKILTFASANAATLKTDPSLSQQERDANTKALEALRDDIGAFRTNPQLAGQQPAYEVASYMDRLKGAL